MNKKHIPILLATIILATIFPLSILEVRCSSTPIEDALLILSEAQAEFLNAKLGYELLLEDADSVLANSKEWLVTTYPANKIENAIMTAEQQLKISEEAVNNARAMQLINKTTEDDVVLIALKARYKASEARAFVADSYSQLWLSIFQNLYNENQGLLKQNEVKDIVAYLDGSKTLRREADVVTVSYMEDALHLRKAVTNMDVKNQRYLSSARKAQIGFQKMNAILTDRTEKTNMYAVMGYVLTPVIIGYSGITTFLYRRLKQAKEKIADYERRFEMNEDERKIGKAIVRF